MAGKPSEAQMNCRICGKWTLGQVWKKEPGLLIRKVMCKPCQIQHGVDEKIKLPECPSCGGKRFSYSDQRDRAYCESRGCSAVIVL